MAWKTFVLPEGDPTCKIEGDPNVAPTRWWNHLYLLWFGWDTVQVFKVERVPAAGFYVGFRDQFGKTMICTDRQHRYLIGLMIGHEGCEFFARTSPDELSGPVTLVPLERITREKAKTQPVAMI